MRIIAAIRAAGGFADQHPGCLAQLAVEKLLPLHVTAVLVRKLSPYWSGEGPVANPDQAFKPEYA